VVVNPNGARPYFKVGVLTAMVRTSMVAFACGIQAPTCVPNACSFFL